MGHKMLTMTLRYSHNRVDSPAGGADVAAAERVTGSAEGARGANGYAKSSPTQWDAGHCRLPRLGRSFEMRENAMDHR
jgi:hypothetical protein